MAAAAAARAMAPGSSSLHALRRAAPPYTIVFINFVFCDLCVLWAGVGATEGEQRPHAAAAAAAVMQRRKSDDLLAVSARARVPLAAAPCGGGGGGAVVPRESRCAEGGKRRRG